MRAFFAILFVLTGCVTGGDEPASVPALSTAEVARRLPARVKAKARDGWAEDIVFGIQAAEREPTAETVCAVIGLIDQESGFQVDPVVAELPRIVREGLERKLAKLGPLAGPAVAALLAGKAPGSDRTFAQRVDRLRTERDLDRLFRDIATAYRGKLPGTLAIASALSMILGRGDLDSLNPVTTAGSMQVKVDFAAGLDDLDGKSDAELREYLYTREGGVRAGTARLFGYEAAYDDVLYRFADYNAGMYASRNAAYQAQLGELTDRKLALDGDLLAYAEDGDAKSTETKSLAAMLAFGRKRDHWDLTIRKDAEKEKSAAFERTDSWSEVREAWAKKHGKEPAYARMPTLTLTSPKLLKPRSTAWFAENVKRRYEACRRLGS